MLIDEILGKRVLVVGDVMLDQYVTGTVDRVSPEAPALVLRVERGVSMLGGAGNVAANIAALGGVAVLVGVVGEDTAAHTIDKLIADVHGGVVDGLVRSPLCRTTEKTRFVANDRHLLRTDAETVGFPGEVQERMTRAIARLAAGCDAIVVSDYAKGAVSKRTMQAAVDASLVHGIPLLADPKRRNFDIYKGADVLTPNVKELEFATGEPCADVASCERAAADIIAMTGAAVLLTRSEAGVALFRPEAEPWIQGASARRVRDVSGAGDTIVAVCAIALAAGASLIEACHFANVAAGVAVGKTGTSSPTLEELNLALLRSEETDALLGKLVTLASAAILREEWHGSGLEVGFTNGCFDLLHPGHIRLLTEARGRCDRLIVALNTDASVHRLKGEGRPVQGELARAEVIGALRAVDLVVLFDEDTPEVLISALAPDVLIKGADYTVETVIGANIVLEAGGRVELIDLVPGHSSTNLIAASRTPRASLNE